MSVLSEFKKFALRGNILDLAIGFTVGAAFTTVVKSLVNDVIMPPIGILIGDVDFSDKFWVLGLPADKTMPEGGFTNLKQATDFGAVTLNYGQFINSCFSLFLIALAMFAIIRIVNRIDSELDEAFGEEPPADDEPSEKKCPHCRTMIPYRASRCPNCTSELEPVAEKTEASQEIANDESADSKAKE